jgi:phenylacetic acid degradation operon negative regulatory protein
VTDARPRSQILYIYGGFVRRLGGWLRVSTLLELMADLGVEPAAVRAAVTRMKRGGLLASSRRGGVAGYALTAKARQILEEGDRRILTAREPASLADGWVLLIFSVPESQRARRHRLRRELGWLGFGTIASGAWIAPQRLRPEVESILARAQLLEYTERFDVASGGLEVSRQLVRKCWDVSGLKQMYSHFVAAWAPQQEHWTSNADVDGSPRLAFQTYIHLIGDWRRLPFLDPGLPTEVLSENWEGDIARSIYFDLIGRLDAPALSYVKSKACEVLAGRPT